MFFWSWLIRLFLLVLNQIYFRITISIRIAPLPSFNFMFRVISTLSFNLFYSISLLLFMHRSCWWIVLVNLFWRAACAFFIHFFFITILFSVVISDWRSSFFPRRWFHMFKRGRFEVLFWLFIWEKFLFRNSIFIRIV